MALRGRKLDGPTPRGCPLLYRTKDAQATRSVIMGCCKERFFLRSSWMRLSRKGEKWPAYFSWSSALFRESLE
jgi:hypothetical protein